MSLIYVPKTGTLQWLYILAIRGNCIEKQIGGNDEYFRQSAGENRIRAYPGENLKDCEKWKLT